jgi:hypothetical protein
MKTITNIKSLQKAGKFIFLAVLVSSVTLFPGVTFASKTSSGLSGVGTTGSGYSLNTTYSNPVYSSPSSGYRLNTTYSNPVYSQPSSSYVYRPTTSGGGGFAAAPAQRYVYNNVGGGGGFGFTPAPQLSYVYTSNTNRNTNTNNNRNTNTNNSTANATNNNSNTFNPVNNNNISLVVLGGGGSNTNTPSEPTLNGNCIISPSTAFINQNLTFMATASGGSGNYTYVWSGSDGISASGQSFTGRFASLGYKTAYVTITAGSQSITRSCNVLIQDTYVPPVNPIGAYCVATPATAFINQNVTWTMYVNGNIWGATSYNWSGTDGLFGNSAQITRSYNFPGPKTASVTAFVNGQGVSATCATTVFANTVASNVTVIRDQPPVTGVPVSGVFLNQVPATGIDFGPKMIVITLAMIAWSVLVGYVFYRYNKPSIDNRIAEFKRKNMLKKGIIG